MFALIAFVWKAQIEFCGRQATLKCRCAMIVKMLLAYENALGLCEGVEIAIEYRWSQPFSLAKSKIESQKFDCCDGGPNTGSKCRRWPHLFARVLDEAFDVPG